MTPRARMRMRSARWAVAAAMALSVILGERRARAEDFTTERAVAIALIRNRDVIAAKLDIQASQVERIAAGIYPNPIAYYSVGNIGVAAGNPQERGLTPGPFSQLVHSVGISQIIDVWAKRSARIKTADLGIEWRRLRVEDALREIIYDVRASFADLEREQAEAELARTISARYDETVRLSRARNRAGEISDIELQKIELEGLKYKNAVFDAESELDLSRQKLAALLAFGSERELPGRAATPLAPRTPPQLDALVKRALETRPDLRAARKGVALYDSAIATAKREAYPDIAVGVSFTHSEFTVSGDNPNTVGLSVTVPLPIFDRNRAGIARAELDATRTQNEIARLELLVRHEVAESVRRIERANLVLDVYEAGGMLSRADNALRVAENSFKAGAVSLLELLEAQRTYSETRARYLHAQFDHAIASIDLRRALGEKLP